MNISVNPVEEVDHNGGVQVGNNASLTVNTPTEWGLGNSGRLRLEGSAVAVPGARMFGARFGVTGTGRVEGNGIVNVVVRNERTIAPGLSTGNIVVQKYVQSSVGSQEMELGGTQAIGQHDQLNVLGAAFLGGTLEVVTIGTYTDPMIPGTVDEFVLVLASSITDGFQNVHYGGLTLVAEFGVAVDGDFRDHVGSGLFRMLDYGPTDVRMMNYKALPGDANGDGTVDGIDFVIWNAHKFTFGTNWTTGDFNGDGIVTARTS